MFIYLDIVSQVNAGPLAYAQAFLDKSVMASHPHKHIEKLQQVYRCVIKTMPICYLRTKFYLTTKSLPNH